MNLLQPIGVRLDRSREGVRSLLEGLELLSDSGEALFEALVLLVLPGFAAELPPEGFLLSVHHQEGTGKGGRCRLSPAFPLEAG